MLGSLKVKVFAGLVLRAMAREQTESGSERIVPRHRSVAGRLGIEPDSPALEAAERYLEREGYIVAPDPGAGGGVGGSRIPARGGRVAQEALVEEDARGLTRAC